MAEVSIEIDDVAKYGVIHDVPPYQLPPEAWTQAENVCFVDDSITCLNGEFPVFGVPGVAPYFSQFVSSAAQPWWLYAGLQKIYVYDGITHTDITRTVGGNYGATGAADWNGTIIGGVPILNDGVDVPQYWGTYSTGTKMLPLPNWTAGMTAKVLRSFGPYLMALNITLGGVAKPHNVRWSSPADPGSIPQSWDITDPTKNAGSVDLPDTDSGLIQDGLPLQGRFFVYKENSTWRFRNVGGRFIFDEDAFLENVGVLCTRCVTIDPTGQQHFFISTDNAWIHNGNSAKPLLDKKNRRYLFNQLDTTNYRNSFVFVNSIRNEGWFCYPSSGNSLPNRSAIINLATGAMTEANCDFQAATIGTLQTSDTDTWASATGSWDTDTSPWSVSNRRKILLTAPVAGKFLQFDLGAVDLNGSPFGGQVSRTGLGVVGRKRTGEWIEDFEVRKMVTRVWPKMSGGQVFIRLGGQDVPNGPIRWSGAVAFDPATQKYVDVFAEGASISIGIQGIAPWQLDGYKLDMVTLGRF